MKPKTNNEFAATRTLGANVKAGVGATLLLVAWITISGVSSGLSGSVNIIANNWYLRMGQWHADLRTLAACASYVARGDSGASAHF